MRHMETETDIADVEKGSSDSSQKEKPKCRNYISRPSRCSLILVAGFFSVFLTGECGKKTSPSPDKAQDQEKAKEKKETWRETQVLKGQP